MSTPQARVIFCRSARSAIPAIRWGVDSFFAGNPRAESFTTARRLVSNIARTATALGLEGIQAPAGYLDNALRALHRANLPPGEVSRIVVVHNIDLLQSSIDPVPLSAAQQAQLRAELDLTYKSLQQHLRRSEPQRRQTAPLPNLEATFTLEAEAQVSAMAAILETLGEPPQRRHGLAALRRRVHTLQGAAAMMGRPDVVGILQQMGTLLERPQLGQDRSETWPLELLFQSIDGLAVLVRRPAADDVAMQIAESILALYESTLNQPQQQAAAVADVASPVAGVPASALLSPAESEIKLSYLQLAPLLARLDDLSGPGRHALQRRLIQLQLLPLERLTERMRRVVRSAAHLSGQTVTLTIDGAELAVDAPTLQAVVMPLQIALQWVTKRGAADPHHRQRAGEPAGHITVGFSQEAEKIVVDVALTGRGRQPLSATDPDYERLRAALAPHGGTVAIDRAAASGGRLTIALPATMIAPPLLRLHVGPDVYAVPRSTAVVTGRLLPGMIQQWGGRSTLNYDGTPIPAVPLAALLGLDDETMAAPRAFLILSAGQARRALLVEDLGESTPLPIQPPGPFLGQLPLVAGMVLPEEGGVLPVLDPTQLLVVPLPAGPARRPDAVSGRPLTVLVVESSLSVRQIGAAILRQAGWEPLLARDGSAALALAARKGQRVDVALVDLDLEDMDALDLAHALRRQLGAPLPIIFSNTRIDADQRHDLSGFERSALLTKPYREEALLALVRRSVARQRDPLPADSGPLAPRPAV